jgi:phosphohistidine phosphatase
LRRRAAGQNVGMTEPRRLYVLRHAKSSWDDAGQRDHDRPLAPRGRRAVKLLAEYVEHNAIAPELVLCSSARRTLETLKGVRPGGDAVIEGELYTASVGQLIDRVRRVRPDVGSVMVIGHNPAMQMLVLRLTRIESASADQLADIRRKFPTGALATLAIADPWAELEAGRAELTDYVRPKALLYQ